VETCTYLSKILHTWNDIHSEHYIVVSQKSTLYLQTYQILNNAAECQEWNNTWTYAANVSRNSL